MIIGIPKEIKNNENRVGITPAGVANFVKNGHHVIIETKAGLGSHITDQQFSDAGATIVVTAAEVWQAEMVIKVKEPLAAEYGYFYEGLILFTYLHLAAEPALAGALVDKKVTAIAYETIQLPDNSLPLLVPMSEIAGRMSIQIGAQFLENPHGGKGILLAGVPGVRRAKVVIVGGGSAGTNAARIAIGMGAQVTILDISAKRLAQLDDQFGNTISTLISDPYHLAAAVSEADLVIGAVLIPGAKAPKLVSEEMVKAMSPGSVLVDIAIDQGGIFATSDHITTHDQPTYVKHGIVHYAVANMPGAVAQTATYALTNVTIPYAVRIANRGVTQSMTKEPAILKGLNAMSGHITYEAVATDLNMSYVAPMTLL
ncbi:alanine dehydrogenase [Brochothrix campestris]|uniref:Alanine dehydrogenase n=1 Tax=Brochothrix campestris FSL F6-1037 TaxID=1265861 RepID=W7DA73_9LIST|nr:alanine dehydrogenase [Brochothrix campestris]EUJ42158.1 alanine dehydrogenase [Brochothrix campestris FSL F6-1037]